MKTWIGMTIQLIAAWLALFSTCNAQEPIKIGLSVPLTGQYAEYGKMIKNGVEFAVTQMNREGGIQGRPLEIVEGDSQGVPETSRRIARKFVSDASIVAEIGDQTSSCSMAAQPVYDKAGMVQLSPTSSHPAFATGSPFSFTMVGSQTAGSPFMVKVAVEQLGKKRLAVAYLATDWGIAVKTSIESEAKRLGAEVVAVESYLDGTTDFSKVISKLRAAQPEVLLLASMTPDAVGLSKQRFQEGWNDVTVMGMMSIAPNVFELGGEAVEGLLVPTIFFAKDSRPEVQRFVDAYQAAYQSSPDWYAAISYDALQLLVSAIKQGGAERQAIHQALSAMKEYVGVTGKIVFNEYGDVVRDYTILQAKQGQFVQFETP